jgi:uncharacterized protein (TIGR02145 family)
MKKSFTFLFSFVLFAIYQHGISATNHFNSFSSCMEQRLIDDLIAVNVAGNGYYGDCYILYRADASDDFDLVYDATYFGGAPQTPQIWTQKQQYKLAVHSVNALSKLNGMTVYFKVGVSATYTMSFQETILPEHNFSIVIRDKHTNTVFFPNEVYTFQATPTDAHDRFEIVQQTTLEVLTSQVTNIYATKAVSGGIVIQDGGIDVIARGVVWDTVPNPSLQVHIGKTTDGAGMGEFISNLIALLPETNYYLRAYATNVSETEYGDEISFTTTAVQLPIISTGNVSNINNTTAIYNGTVLYDGGLPIQILGVVWDTVMNATVEVNDGFIATVKGEGDFTTELKGLIPNTKYYLMAYAQNLVGVVYGEHIEFTTTCLPEYEYSTNYQFNMQIIAKIEIEGELSLDEQNSVVAFSGEECRGMAFPSTNHNGLIFLTIYSNMDSGEPLRLKLLNKSSCRVCDVYPEFTFENGVLIGTADYPYIIKCGLKSPVNFGQGFTWYSVNLETENMKPGRVFSGLTPCDNDRIIGQNSFSVYYSAGWFGSLTQMNTSTMYKLKLCSNQTNILKGNITQNQSFNLNAGYTWLGYPLQICMDINKALSNINPPPTQNDRLIGQTAFAIYLGNSWIGSLSQLCPHQGYIIKLSQNSVLEFPLFPQVYTRKIISSTCSTATVQSKIQGLTGNEIISRGICWSTSEYPTIDNARTSEDGEIGEFNSTATDLTRNTSYFVRAYATTAYGTVYGEQIEFSTKQFCFFCGGNIIDFRDGNVYPIVQIGEQCWMVKNLAYLPIVHSNSEFSTQGSSSLPGYGVYGYNGSDIATAKSKANYSNYGVLYNWFAVNQGGANAICPTGWHVASDAEWTQLVDYVVAQGYPNSNAANNGAGNALKSCRQAGSPLGGVCSTGAHPRWDNSHSTIHGFDQFGFTALPGGERNPDGTFFIIGNSGYWWSSTGAWRRRMYYGHGSMNRSGDNKATGFSVRCLWD